MLGREDYLEVVKKTQVVSIDLIITDNNGKILVGKRKNAPARGTYFVPGGRVFKNETLDQGFKRILKDEIGITDLRKIRRNFNCVTDHIYPNNFADALDINGDAIPMHFVCIGINVYIEPNTEFDMKTFQIQHEDSLWLTQKELLLHKNVHEYTKRYFMESDKRLC